MTQRLTEAPSRHVPQGYDEKITARMDVQSNLFTYFGTRVPTLAADVLVRQDPNEEEEEEEEEEEDDRKEEDDDEDDNGDGYSE
jgi:hypothetical protein